MRAHRFVEVLQVMVARGPTAIHTGVVDEDVKPPRPGRGFIGMVKDRFSSFAMVLGVAFLLLISLVVSAALAALGTLGAGLAAESLLHALNFVVSLAVVTGLFAAIFKYVPDVRVEWRDVWFGAAVTALFFTVGKLAIGLYLGKAGVASAFGAAGSLIIVLVNNSIRAG